MQVEELVDFLDWLDEEVRKPNLVNLYEQLHNILNQAAQPNQQKKPFEEQRDALINAVLGVKLSALNYSQTQFAERIGLLDLVGERAKETIEDVLYKNVIDIATSAEKIKELRDALNTLLDNLAMVSAGLSKYVEAAPAEYEEALIHIRFQHEASIKNIVDLKKWGNAWFEIGRGIALANKVPPEEIKIIGASRGSLVYDLAVCYSIASLLTGIILKVLKVADRVLDIRKKAEEIRGMKLTNNKAAKELETEAKKIEEEGQVEVLEEIKSGKKLNGEQETALQKAIGKIFDFISGGGEIDVHIEEEADEDADEEEGEESDKVPSKDQKVIAEIKQSFQEIKRLEAKLLLIKDRNP